MNEADLTKDLRHLGKTTDYSYHEPDARLLDTFPSPLRQEYTTTEDGKSQWFSGSVHIECPEFTSLCPKTGQPDFATIVIDYLPREKCVESKSLKLYLGSFRMHGEFHESCVQRIANDLVALLDPIELKVEGQFTPRGGIPFWPTVRYQSAL